MMGTGKMTIVVALVHTVYLRGLDTERCTLEDGKMTKDMNVSMSFAQCKELLSLCFQYTAKITKLWTVEWAQFFVQQPLPLSFADQPTFLLVRLGSVSQLTVGKEQQWIQATNSTLRCRKGKKQIHSFLFLTLSLNFTYTQLTTTRKNVGRSVKEHGLAVVQKLEPIPWFRYCHSIICAARDPVSFLNWNF